MTIIRNTNGAGLESLKNYIGDLTQKHIVVGVTPEHNARPDGGSNAMLGAIHEFGVPSKNIAERSWLRSTIVENGAEYSKALAEGIPNAIARGIDADVAYNTLGEKASGDVKFKIANGSFTPLKQKTIDRKGSSKPLIDKGHFRLSISHEVR